MHITLNNNPEIFSHEQLSISEILQIKNFTFKLLVIKLNNQIIHKIDYDTTFVKDGDDLKIIHLMSGG